MPEVTYICTYFDIIFYWLILDILFLWMLRIRADKRVREQIPFISDLLFVHDTAEALNPIVSKTPTLQYCYNRGGVYCEPVPVPDRDMQRFYFPEEILRPCTVGVSALWVTNLTATRAASSLSVVRASSVCLLHFHVCWQ